MKVIKIDIKKTDQKIIDEIVGYLNRSKIIVYPTDTIYGIGCDAINKKAIKKIFKIKKRDKSKALLILVKSWCMVKKYTFLSAKQDKYMRSLWPGSVSVILRKRKDLPKELTGGMDSVAVRMPKNDFLINIIKKLDKPLVSTSVNLSGEKSLLNPSDIEQYFKNKKEKPDLIIDAGKLKSKKSSKLIDIRDIDDIKILRK